MAMASVKATDKIMAVWILDPASGFLPIDSTALEAILLMANAGITAPKAIVAPAVIDLIASRSNGILFLVINYLLIIFMIRYQ